MLRLEFDHSHLDYYTEIDAVHMSGLMEPIRNCLNNLTNENNTEYVSNSQLENVSDSFSFLYFIEFSMNNNYFIFLYYIP